MSSNAELDSFPLAEIREGTLNVRELRSGKKAIVIRNGDEIRAFHETCPHMGADLSEGTYCAKKGTLQCRWHGYIYDADDGKFLENPNEKIMQLIRVPSEHFKPEKTPRYRLALIPSVVKDGRLVIGKATDAAYAEGGQT